MNVIRKKTILIIDDEAKFADGLSLFLTNYKYEVHTAYHVNEAYKVLDETAPDLILCDVMMPDIDGFSFRNQLSYSPHTNNIPFIFLTARTDGSDLLYGFESGADDYLTKPFKRAELLARIRAVLNRDEKSRQVAEAQYSQMLEDFKEELLSNINHELYTPLGVTIMSLDILLQKRFDNVEERTEFIKIAQSGAKQMMFLIDSLIMLNKMVESNGTERSFFHHRPLVDLNFHLFPQVDERLEFYKPKTVFIDYKIEKELEIYAPKREFSCAAVHLIDNAIKYSPDNGRIMIDLSSLGDGGCVLVVTDEGQGVPDDKAEKVFEKYYQISKGDNRSYGGLGVGLTIARYIARSFGGDVEFLPTTKGAKVQMAIPQVV